MTNKVMEAITAVVDGDGYGACYDIYDHEDYHEPVKEEALAALTLLQKDVNDAIEKLSQV